MLQLRPNCERCDHDLPGDSVDALICSFECTFCRSCAEALGLRCPNCQGPLHTRPPRLGLALQRHPASTERVFKPATGNSRTGDASA